MDEDIPRTRCKGGRDFGAKCRKERRDHNKKTELINNIEQKFKMLEQGST